MLARGRMLGSLLVIAAATGCYQAPSMSVEGNLEVNSERVGDWSLNPGICIGGYNGSIDVSSHDGEHCVRFVDDPERGPSVIAVAPDTLEEIAFTEADCDQFYVRRTRTLDQGGSLYNHGGVIDVDCQTSEGSIQGVVQFDGCW